MSREGDTIALLERYAPKGFGSILPRAETVRAANIAPQEIRRMAIRAYFRRGKEKKVATPRYVLDALAVEYERDKNAARVARTLGIATTHVHYLITRYGLPRKKRPKPKKIYHNGIKYTEDANGYWRQTTRGKQNVFLHKVVWSERNGPIPPGRKLKFVGDNKSDFSPRNLVCVSVSECRRICGSQNGSR